eukprot:671904-Hanusia_phi.AAC.3
MHNADNILMLGDGVSKGEVEVDRTNEANNPNDVTDDPQSQDPRTTCWSAKLATDGARKAKESEARLLRMKGKRGYRRRRTEPAWRASDSMLAPSQWQGEHAARRQKRVEHRSRCKGGGARVADAKPDRPSAPTEDREDRGLRGPRK